MYLHIRNMHTECCAYVTDGAIKQLSV